MPYSKFIILLITELVKKRKYTKNIYLPEGFQGITFPDLSLAINGAEL
jgi:hypothetical protein